MSDQKSQKTGVRSDAQKTTRAREGYDTIPASQPAAGAFGGHASQLASDEDLSLKLNEKRMREQSNDEGDSSQRAE
jgi:hypothetical protein